MVVILCVASLVAQTVKNLLKVQATWVGSLSQEDPLEKGVAIHSSIFTCCYSKTVICEEWVKQMSNCGIFYNPLCF